MTTAGRRLLAQHLADTTPPAPKGENPIRAAFWLVVGLLAGGVVIAAALRGCG